MEQAAEVGVRGGAAYFRRGRLPWFAVIAVSMGYYAWAVFWPQSIPYQKLGPLGSFTQYLADHHHTLLGNGFWLAWMVHILESLYALVLCKFQKKALDCLSRKKPLPRGCCTGPKKQKGITDGRARLLWFIQTFLFGIASLSLLIAYRPVRQKRK
ncbi:transmembrane protein 254 isoform X1 [Ornithorhynchus anatinus]|uniref:transmembrane protein 254 isoform X1 n=1 Tax=Ornithorhynchus anatinus TaxID=9258 RepID=UPI0010A866C3|nr:transmembrane protein 254 isoform X1 [Ornithorhynchus anatinus]